MERTHDDELLTIKEAAALLKMSTVTVRRWLKQGRLVGYRVGARSIRLRRHDVEAMLEPEGNGVTTEALARREDAIKRLRERREEMAQRNGGNLMASSVEMIRAERNRRSYLPDWSPVSAETLARRGKAIKRLRELRAEMARRHGDKPMASSVDLIREDRERDS
jgi:excisionase family DNA binding protein